MARKISKKSLICSIIGIMLLLLIIWTVWGNSALELNTITVTSARLPEAFSGYRIAQVSDLHNTQMGKENEKLIAMLKEAEPDIIAITGDMIDSSRTDVEVALQFAKEAVEIAPCYYVTGNHEAIADAAFAQLESGLTELGVVVLRDAVLPLEKNGETISLIGLDDLGFSSVNDRIEEATANMEQTLNALVGDNTSYTLLLAHRPELMDIYVTGDVDLVLSGHAHGGQFRLPLIGGLVAPGQGLFPEYDAGLYTEGATSMVVSRGIGNSVIPFRFNNRPEVVLVELQAENESELGHPIHDSL